MVSLFDVSLGVGGVANGEPGRGRLTNIDMVWGEGRAAIRHGPEFPLASFEWELI